MFMQVYNHGSRSRAGGQRRHHLRHAGQPLLADRSRRNQPVRLPRRTGARPKASCPRRTRPPASGPPRARCCSTRSRSSRSTTARSRSRSSTRPTSPNRPRPSSTSRGPPAGPASSTSRATGAAVAPPAPSLTSITHTAIRGCSAGAKAANQASVLLASVSVPWHSLRFGVSVRAFRGGRFPARGRWVQGVFSSAVPVLPATTTPGIAAAVPVPERTTPIIRRRTVRATAGAGRSFDERRVRIEQERRLRPPPAVGDRRSPRSPSAAASPGPRPGRSPSSRCPVRLGSARPAAACSQARRRCPGSWLKPNSSAVATSRAEPSLTPERGEDRVAGHREGVFERAAAFLAVGVVQPDPVEGRVGRVGEHGLRVGHARLQDAREGDHLERRARRLQAVQADARHGEDLPGGGCERDDAPELTAERGDGCALQRRRDAGAHGPALPGRGDGASTRLPASSSPPGVPRRLSSSARSSPLSPTRASAGTPCASSACAARGGDRTDRPDGRARDFAQR